MEINKKILKKRSCNFYNERTVFTYANTRII